MQITYRCALALIVTGCLAIPAFAAPPVTTYLYDAQGNLKEAQAPLGRTTRSAYDALNRLTTLTDPAAGITSYGYDGQDQLTSVTDPRGKATTYTIDGLGNLTQEASPDRGNTIMTYDAAGNLATRKDARNITATYAYDALNRPIGVSFSNGSPTIYYGYDSPDQNLSPGGIGRLAGVSDATTGSAGFGWTQEGQPRVRSFAFPSGVSLFTSWAYDQYGRKQVMTYPSGKMVGFTYDGAGRMQYVMLFNPQVLLYGVLDYLPFGPPRIAARGNNIPMVRSFDQYGRTVQYKVEGGNRFLFYDDAGRVALYLHDNQAVLNQSFGYDTLDRLTGWDGLSQNRSYAYDANGNRTNLTVSGNSYPYTVASSSNRLASTAGPAPARNFSYDAMGSVQNDGQISYTYDARGRMIRATIGGSQVNYGVNGLGERVFKTGPTNLVPGGTIYFAYDEAGHLIGEYDAQGVPIQEYVWMGDEPIAIIKGSQVHFIETDHLGTPIRVTNQQGQLAWRWNQEPFGSLLPETNPSGLGPFTLNLRMPGQYFDKETGLHYNYFRDYDPQTGRYMESDPIGLAGGNNTYLYVNGNPIALIDLLGLQEMNPDFINQNLIGPRFLSLTTFAALERGVTLDEAVTRGAGFRGVTAPALMTALSPEAIGLVAISATPVITASACYAGEMYASYRVRNFIASSILALGAGQKTLGTVIPEGLARSAPASQSATIARIAQAAAAAQRAAQYAPRINRPVIPE